MFWRRAKTTDETVTTPAAADSGEASFAAARRASDVLFDTLVRTMRVEHGAPAEAVVLTLGALAGHACQVAAIHGVGTGRAEYRALAAPLVTVQTAAGQNLLMGDAINRTLLEGRHSVWSLVAGILQHMGRELPDIRALVEHSVRTAGTAEFGVIDGLPPTIQDPRPRTFLAMWPFVAGATGDVTDPDHVPMAVALAFQRLVQTENAVDPTTDVTALARILMQSALTTAKLQVLPQELTLAGAT